LELNKKKHIISYVLFITGLKTSLSSVIHEELTEVQNEIPRFLTIFIPNLVLVYIEGKDLQETMHHAFKGVGV
jgi:hypothetical protein